MKVTVTLEARATATEDHIVKCAYGKNSNPAHQTVTLSPEKNSFTLVCGDQGDVLPTNHKEEYCVSDTGSDEVESCTGAYEGIFANYEATWWAATTDIKEYKFTIPDGQFPAEAQMITVGCQNTAVEPGTQPKEVGEKDSSVCSVDVRIVASAASSAALTSGMAVTLLSLAAFFSTPLLKIGVRMGLRVILVFVSAFLLLDSLPFSGCVRAVADEPTDPACVIAGAVTKCTCTSKEVTNKDLTATLSQEKNVLEIGCNKRELKCVPAELNGKLVCPSTTAELKSCKSGETRTTVQPFDINTLLSGTSPKVSWQSCEGNGDGTCTTKQLTIPPANFPFVDHKFMVGCVEAETTDTMKVTVTLEARPSETEDHIVRCAYGKNSNNAHQTVTLTPEKNSFTLVCGNEGEVLPTTYETNYCLTQEGNDAGAQCTGAYGGIFPNYEETWWTTTPHTNEYKFTIPEGQFPAEEQKITVGCQKKATAEPGKQRTESEEKDSSVCSVDVTIVASAASSAALTSGLAVTLVSIAGMVYATVF
ncbi:SRS domain-containing protein [Neospora caninum Liverpool]|uniref:SRS domain-containing protein n=1 Tax=Neospora caninum (strain Liverpool) TaxID=572307 RepID=F0VIU6_NEOCL|nr:SRS domain-containing protein [Neospora caninum Liverpool]CBZ53657.1 SRS domain-containing protein [Neospora caninum Liverpool]CEL67648.1 TPA: SRS domain-containing protein [Neospora caninum Liverpool]|eukprot:XP_003883689.1 SRS domain-containing protein [Neospora caninum Liverpool]